MSAELLLFVLFMLFSLFSALMERRKRRKQAEEAQQRQETRKQRQAEGEAEVAASPVVEEQQEEGPPFGWSFAGDPFKDFKPAVDSESVSPEQQALIAEREALDAERRALAAERRALAMERMSLETRPRHAIEERIGSAGEKRRYARVQVGRWRLDPHKARDAIVYMEILGKPKAEREEL
ncbi:MAG: hypothetical protein VX293_12460 [Candidatus Latescibacterota bacterium]|nr:hypothetical protein [Candidatus Latescibacterota bacterium]